MDALQVAINEEADRALEKVKEEWLEKVDELKGNNIQTENLTKQSYIVQCEIGESPATLEIHPECGKLWTDRMIDVTLAVSENKIIVKKEEETCDVISDEEMARRARNKALKALGPKEEEACPIDIVSVGETEI